MALDILVIFWRYSADQYQYQFGVTGQGVATAEAYYGGDVLRRHGGCLWFWGGKQWFYGNCTGLF